MNIILLINGCIAVLAVMFAYQAIIDLLDGRTIGLYRSKKHGGRIHKISAVIEFSGNRDEFLNQLKGLENQDYRDLEIIILVGSKYSEELKYTLHSIYKSTTKIRAIGYERNQSLKKVLDKSCSGSLIMLLNHHDKLSKSFFDFVNINANLQPSQMIFYPAHQFRIDNSILSLLFAQAEMFRRFWIDALGIKINLGRIHSGVIYRHKIIQNTGHIRVPVNRLIFISRKSSLVSMFDYLDYRVRDMEIKFGRLIYIIIGLVTSFAVFTGLIFVDNKTIVTSIIFAVIAYFIINLFMQFRLKGYVIMERLNLIMIAPIVLIINSLIVVLGLLARIVGLFNKRVG